METEMPTTFAGFMSVLDDLRALRLKLTELGLRKHALDALNVAIAVMEREAAMTEIREKL